MAGTRWNPICLHIILGNNTQDFVSTFEFEISFGDNLKSKNRFSSNCYSFYGSVICASWLKLLTLVFFREFMHFLQESKTKSKTVENSRKRTLEAQGKNFIRKMLGRYSHPQKVGLSVQMSWCKRWHSCQELESKNLISFYFEIKTVICVTLPFLIAPRTPQVFKYTLLWMLRGRKIRDGFGYLHYLTLLSKLLLKVNLYVKLIYMAC